ncbi:MAG: glutamine--fructose-6-phosphate transaminase (isomerizing), partial [Nitrospirae bacterium]|nr:glutamine--fructose-6-phosphate transaminase (isomerizing) [Nitrospirota bacterium]
MCGIVGYVGKRNSLPILIEGLKRLEYRGYDSAGIAFQNGSGIEIYKTKGKIRDLQKILPHPAPDALVGLGHTRWATHGVPSSRNAHPHGTNGIVVVHNGIIENYRNLRAHLIDEGFEFSSDTDTEVIPQMISRYLRRNLSMLEAIKETVAQLRGTFAIGIMNEALPNTLFSIRRGSPLVIGIGDGEYFFASDVSALLPYTQRFIFMEDGQICTIGCDGIELRHLDSSEATPVETQAVEIDWTPSMAEKDGYDHFMLKEIHEQPRAIMDTIREWTDDPERMLDDLGLTVRKTIGLNRLQVVACGTSYHAALVGKYMIEDIARISVDVEIASEYRYKRPIIEHDTLFISITQSGETADTLAAQREARKRGAWTLTICNVVGSTSSREADSVLYTRAGPEIGVASTKAFTCQISALCLLAIALGIRMGRLTPGEAGTLRSQLLKIPSFMEKTLRMNSAIEELARTLIYAKAFLYLGRGINYPIALEGALKLKEISYIPAEGYPAGEMKHGPIALIEEGLPVVVLAPVDNLFEKTLSNIEEVKARGGRVIAVTDEPESLRDKVDDLITVPSAHFSLSPLINVIPL